jgi:hypothetical protein
MENIKFRCANCGFEWNGPDLDCYSCHSENVYPIPENIDYEIGGEPRQEEKKNKFILTGEALRDKLKKSKYG